MTHQANFWDWDATHNIYTLSSRNTRGYYTPLILIKSKASKLCTKNQSQASGHKLGAHKFNVKVWL